ncbi:MAG TPA: ABC transporter ATP-binding protein [Acidimicrobiales bacterium]|nr:ABC transporter ATP-binding protein [Acidimicrobiales bacterium]
MAGALLGSAGTHDVTLAAIAVTTGPVRHTHFRIGFLVVILVVLAVIVYLVVRSRERRSHHHGQGDDSWARQPPPGYGDPPSVGGAPLSGDGARPPAPPGGEAPPFTRGADGTAPAPVGSPLPSSPPVAAPRPRRQVRLEGEPAEGWAVETTGLTKRFGSNVAVDHVDLRVPRGVAFGYLGPNGAGKTTLIRTLLGLTKADGGTMSLLGEPVPARRREALAKVGAIVDEPRFFGHLTGRENLLMLAAARGGGAEARIVPSLERVGLAGRADDKVRQYSMGMRQRLGVAACLLGDPELLILDEPMNGLDPAGMHEMRALILSFVDEGRTVVLSSHLLDEVERTCDAVAIVDRGHIVRQGPIDELVRGAGSSVLRVECAEPEEAARLLRAAGVSGDATPTGIGVDVALPPDAGREFIAEVNRILVEGRIPVYGLQEMRTSLEEWFLSVTSRLGAPQ